MDIKIRRLRDTDDTDRVPSTRPDVLQYSNELQARAKFNINVRPSFFSSAAIANEEYECFVRSNAFVYGVHSTSFLCFVM